MKKFIFLLFLIFLLCPVFVFAEQIDINSATLSQLDEIVHIGPKTAQKIIDDRPYSSVHDLNRVKGVGDGKYLKDIISQGWACVNCQTETVQAQQPTEVVPTQDAPAIEPIKATNGPVEETPATVYPGGVIINEIMPNPKGPDETDEWIELYNSNNFDVDLIAWQLQDTVGTITTYTILPGTKILANSFLVLKRPDTNIMLNNDKDGLNLLAPDKKIVDSVSFASAPLNQSYNKTYPVRNNISNGVSSSWQWSTSFTPGAKNIIAVLEVRTASEALPKPKKSDNTKNIEPADLTANSSQEAKNITNPWFLFFTALVITIISAAVVLFIKLKISKNHVGT